MTFTAAVTQRYPSLDRRSFTAVTSQADQKWNPLNFLPPGTPFKQTEWPNPRGRSPISAQFTWTQNSKLPEPIRTVFRLPVTFRTWRQNPNLVATNSQSWVFQNPSALHLAAAPPAKPVFNYDWPNPRGHRRNVTEKTHIDYFVYLQAQFYGDPNQPPPNYDFPNPRGYTPNIDLRTWIQTSNIVVTTTFDTPFNQTEFPNPLQSNSYILRDWNQNLLETTFSLPIFAPFYQTSFPNPRGPKFPIELRSTYTTRVPPPVQGIVGVVDLTDKSTIKLTLSDVSVTSLTLDNKPVE